jgi:hypothetical protein
MRNNSKWIWILGAFLIAGMIGCKKGDTGPAGPEGPQGPAGPDSVVYSPWINLSPTYVEDDTLFEDTVVAASITKDILDKGVILTYVNIGTSSDPDVVPVSSLNYIFAFEEFTVGNIYLTIFPNYDLSDLPFRYVTIPGSKIEGNRTTGLVNGYTIKELQYMSYEHVQSVLGN